MRTVVKLLPWEIAHFFVWHTVAAVAPGDGVFPPWLIVGLVVADMLPVAYVLDGARSQPRAPRTARPRRGHARGQGVAASRRSRRARNSGTAKAAAVTAASGRKTHARRIPMRPPSITMKMPDATASTSRSTCSDWVAGPFENHSPKNADCCVIARMLRVQVPIRPRIATTR